MELDDGKPAPPPSLSESDPQCLVKNIPDLSNLCPAVEIVRTETLGANPGRRNRILARDKSHNRFRDSAVVFQNLIRAQGNARARRASGFAVGEFEASILARTGVTNSVATL